MIIIMWLAIIELVGKLIGIMKLYFMVQKQRLMGISVYSNTPFDARINRAAADAKPMARLKAKAATYVIRHAAKLRCLEPGLAWAFEHGGKAIANAPTLNIRRRIQWF
jgi:hypothetical protein